MGRKKQRAESDAVNKTLVVGGVTYRLDARHVPGGWFGSWHCPTCHAVGAASGTHRTVAAAMAAARRDLKLHHRDSHHTT